MSRRALGKKYTDSECIIRQGESGDCMYVVQTGRVEILQHGQDGQEQHLAYLGAGSFFGEMSVFEREVRSASVRAVGDARVLRIDRRTLLRRIREDPLLAINLLKIMSGRIRELNDEVSRHREISL